MSEKRQRKHAAEVFQEVLGQANEPESAYQDAYDLQEVALNYAPSPAPNVPPIPQQTVAAAPAQRIAPAASKSGGIPPISIFKSSEELQLETEPVRVRETGFWVWKRVIVPPNVYVVHTRIGKKDPVTIGLGVSFRYNPMTDAYLVVPAAMQTIGVVANCISKEKQGINVLAYVQWQIADFSVAYRKLDFSDSRDPLGIVNAQLREQAEAAIKDKIATMSVEEVLTDKEPVIEELTTRLKAVAEGRIQDKSQVNEGLGIKIVTVQIKEALVSSRRLWEHLQAPFRYEKEKSARISQLEMQDEIRQKELDTRRAAETSEAETYVEIERIKQVKETEALQLRLTEQAARFTREQESKREKIQLEEQTTLIQRESEQRLEAQRARANHENKLEQARLDAEAEARLKALQVEQALAQMAEETRLGVAKLQAEQERLQRETTLHTMQSQFDLLAQSQQTELETARHEAELNSQRRAQMLQLELDEARLRLLEKETEIARLQQEIRNLISERDLMSRLVEKLPDLAAHMPDVHELRVLQTDSGGYNVLASFLSQVKMVVESLKGSSNSAEGN